MTIYHVSYDLLSDSYSVRTEECESYSGYTGILDDTVYEDGTSWTDWNATLEEYDGLL